MNSDFKPDVTFSTLKREDIPYLIGWLRQPHVLEYWPHHLADEEIWKKYEAHIDSDWVFPFLIQIGAQPIGYIQCYQSWREGNGWWPNEKAGTYGLDLFLGKPEYLGRGYGSIVLGAFIETIQNTHQVTQWIIDVDPKNTRAKRCYQKVGFKETETIQTPEGEALLMRLSGKNGKPSYEHL